MDFSTVITLLIIPAFGALSGVVVYLWKAQTNLHKEIISQKDEYIALLKEDKKELGKDLDKLKERLMRAEQELLSVQQSLQLMQASNASLPLPAWMKDRNGNVLSCNPAYEKIFLIPRGYKLHDYMGHKDKDVWPEHVANAFEINDKAVLSSQEVIDTIEQITAPDGKDYPCRVIKFPRLAGTLVVGVDGIAIPDDLSPWTSPSM